MSSYIYVKIYVSLYIYGQQDFIVLTFWALFSDVGTPGR